MNVTDNESLHTDYSSEVKNDNFSLKLLHEKVKKPQD